MFGPIKTSDYLSNQSIVIGIITLRQLLRLVVIAVACHRVEIINSPKPIGLTVLGYVIDL